jgi:hypothetical protein
MYDVTEQFTSISAWRTYLGGTSISGKEAGSIIDDPEFEDATGTTPADFMLATGSPCINAGRVGGVSVGAAIDMGCWGGASQIGVDF